MGERRRVCLVVAASFAFGSMAWGLAASQSGCQLQQVCTPSTVYVPASAAPKGASSQSFESTAGMYGDIWQSSAIDGEWMSLPPQVTYIIYPQLPDGRPFVGPYVPAAQISAYQSPYFPDPSTNAGANFAQSAGNPTQFAGLDDGGLTGFQVMNNTCTQYYLFLTLSHEPPLAASLDASSAFDASNASDSSSSPDSSDQAPDASDAGGD